MDDNRGQDYSITITVEASFWARDLQDANSFVFDLKRALMSGTITDEEVSRRGCDIGDVCEVTGISELRVSK